MSNIKVSVLILLNEADRIEELNNRFIGTVSRLIGEEASLNQMWKGEANDAFHHAFMTDEQKMMQLYKLMDQYVKTLRSIAFRYNTTEKNNTCTARTRTY